MTNLEMIICDAHIHIGYYPRKGYDDPFYYSPKRILNILNHAGIAHFIFSSTNAIWDFNGEDMHREACEMILLAGERAHPFFWVTDEYLKNDKYLNLLPSFYEGIKLHGGETNWLGNPQMLNNVLAIARERHLPVQIHTDDSTGEYGNPISRYLPFCKKYKEINFDLVHGRPNNEAIKAINENDNVYVDCSYGNSQMVNEWLKKGGREDRILFGSDIPVQQKLISISLTNYLRNFLKNITSRYVLSSNFFLFLHKNHPGYSIDI